MAAIEVLAPLRIETRFFPPGTKSPTDWVLLLRVYPDEFSMARRPNPPTPDELDLLDRTLAASAQDGALEPGAFMTLATAVGGPRAVHLVRSCTNVVDGRRHADRTLQRVKDPQAAPLVHLPEGLPPALDVWVLRKGAAPWLAGTLPLNRDKIARDLDLKDFSEAAKEAGGGTPERWWNSFQRACDVGLGARIALGPSKPDLDAVVVVGRGDTSPAALFEAHAASGRMAILAPGTPTNTVEGEPTTELGRTPGAWAGLAATTMSTQPGTQAVTRAVTGVDATTPLLGGELDPEGPTQALVTALWPSLWSRAIREVAGAAEAESSIADWAREWLAPEGPYPAIRVGEQPYGLIPAAALDRWKADADDAAVESLLRAWTLGWRSLAAAAAAAATGVKGASTDQLLALFAESAPTRAWAVRVSAPLDDVNGYRVARDMPSLGTSAWENGTVQALAGQAMRPLAPLTGAYPLPELPRLQAADEKNTRLLHELIDLPDSLFRHDLTLGLLGHLLRDSMLVARAMIGQAFRQLPASPDPNALWAHWPQAHDWLELVSDGNNGNLQDLESVGGESGREIAHRFRQFQKAAHTVIEWLQSDPDRVYATLLAVLDTASHRVDPWVMGLAARRLRTLDAAGAPRFLGAYGWVDSPAPYTGEVKGPLAPGPTESGLLHAPSPNQAFTAALLRDAAVRHPNDPRWKIELDSQKVRDAKRLAERVRLGVHPYEALGLEVERVVGDWNTVRILRQEFKLTPKSDERRVCDGARVLRVVLHQTEPLPIRLIPLEVDLRGRLEPLDHVLDTYADLLIADGVHAQVSGRGDLAQAAMEAAAGLSAPPELRAIRTPRGHRDVRVSVWAALEPNSEARSSAVAVAADPSFANLLDQQLGEAAAWAWDIGDPGTPVTLADVGLHAAELVSLNSDVIEALLRGAVPPGTPVHSNGGGEKLELARRLADLLGGGDDGSVVPGTTSGRDDEAALPSPLRDQMLLDLRTRLDDLITSARQLVAILTNLAEDIATPALAVRLRQWGLPQFAGEAIKLRGTALEDRIKVVATLPTATVNEVRSAIRLLTGHARLPILPVIETRLLHELRSPQADQSGLELVDNEAGRPRIDREWLEVVAAVRPRMAMLESWQFAPAREPWVAWMSAGVTSPWTAGDNLVIAYSPSANAITQSQVAIAALDSWVDAIPSTEHATAAAFGFNGPKSRPPQAILLGVPAEARTRMDSDELLQLLLETRDLAKARAARPDVGVPRVATPSPVLDVTSRASFLKDWP
ncbi:MAG: hypothetical protein NW204_09485 [Xanthomonadaceae bacterium]|nr:hypothetical protein [Xanthomonadaceae bacterium]